jgi:predicted enzyme related to lactoylglutathione lyase
LGGKIAVPVMAIPNTGKFSIVQDPPGALFAIFQPAMRG